MTAVSRIVCSATTFDVEMIVDVASEVFALGAKERFSLCITPTLRTDGRIDDDIFDQSGRETLLDAYDYGMCGRVFQFDVDGEDTAVMISFGGLLMRLAGRKSYLSKIKLDSRVYALFRRTTTR